MARPRKGEPRPDTELVAFRFSRLLLQAIDEHARRMSATRSDAARDLVQRGLGTLDPSAKLSGTSTAKRPIRSRTSKRPSSVSSSSSSVTEPRSTAKADCGWCGARQGRPHYARCPGATSSLNGIFAVAARAANRRSPKRAK